jgi:hypothetical protein
MHSYTCRQWRTGQVSKSANAEFAPSESKLLLPLVALPFFEGATGRLNLVDDIYII